MGNNEIIGLEEVLRQAMLDGDVDKLDELIADSLVFTLPTGTVIDKKADLDAHRSGIQKITKLDASDQNIQIHDNFAIVTVKMNLAGTYNDTPIDGLYRYTRVWGKIEESWKILAGHASRISP